MARLDLWGRKGRRGRQDLLGKPGRWGRKVCKVRLVPPGHRVFKERLDQQALKGYRVRPALPGRRAFKEK